MTIMGTGKDFATDTYKETLFKGILTNEIK